MAILALQLISSSTSLRREADEPRTRSRVPGGRIGRDELRAHEGRVVGARIGGELRVRATLDNRAFAEDEDLVRTYDRREAVGDDDGGAIDHESVEC